MTLVEYPKYALKFMMDIFFDYLKDPRIVPYPLATLKCSHALTSWTCLDFFSTDL